MTPDSETGDIPLHTDYQDPPRFQDDSPSTSDFHSPRKSLPLSETQSHPFKWSRRIAITTQPLWIARIRRHKFRTFALIFFPSLVIFLLAFLLAPATAHSRTNGLNFYAGAVWKPNMLITAGVVPKRFHSHEDCEYVLL